MNITAPEARVLADMENNVSTLTEAMLLIHNAATVGNYSVIINDNLLSQELETLVESGFTIHRVDEWRLRITW